MALFLAHELHTHTYAYNWFSGADTDTWEDWLNETGAEWATLLFSFEISEGAFNEKVEYYQNNYKSTPIIKSPDGSRPSSGVHQRGTAMFYEIYKKYGKETIIMILQTFVELKIKTTAKLLQALPNDIANIIEKGLLLEDYDCLRD